MRVCLVTPAAPGSYHGNRVTAQRWAGIITGLGHQVDVTQSYHGQAADLLVALHARKSADSVREFRATKTGRPVVLALTGTDLYPDLAASGVPDDVLDLADRFVVLQPLAVDQLPPRLRGRARVIYQSVTPPAAGRPRRRRTFDAVLLAHLRPVKDPLLAAAAARLLPDNSPVRIRHAGAVIDRDLAAEAERESRTNPRYEWLGEMPWPAAHRLLAASRLLLVTSRHEGGANVVSEALAVSVPVLGTRIPGTVGLLGPGYPGYFPAGGTAALAALLDRAQRDDGGLYGRLSRHCAALRPLTDPAREHESWRRLLAELTGSPDTAHPTGRSAPRAVSGKSE